MKIFFKAIGFIGICIVVIYLGENVFLRFECNKEMKAVQQLLSSSSMWNHVQVRHSVSWKLIVVGTVDSEESLIELRRELKQIGAKKSTIAVGISSNTVLMKTP